MMGNCCIFIDNSFFYIKGHFDLSNQGGLSYGSRTKDKENSY